MASFGTGIKPCFGRLSSLAGTGEDIREATESEDDSFASQQFFAEEALGGIEEELLRSNSDNFFMVNLAN